MDNEQQKIKGIFEKMNHLKTGFDSYIKLVYSEYERLIAEYMIIKGKKNGDTISFKVPLIIADSEGIMSQVEGEIMMDRIFESEFQSSGYDSYFDFEASDSDNINDMERYVPGDDSYNYAVDYKNIWQFLDEKESIYNLTYQTESFNNVVELIYIFMLEDVEQKIVTLSIKRIDHDKDTIFRKQKLIEIGDNEFLKILYNNYYYGDRTFLSPMRISETCGLLSNLHIPISAPDFIMRIFSPIDSDEMKDLDKFDSDPDDDLLDFSCFY